MRNLTRATHRLGLGAALMVSGSLAVGQDVVVEARPGGSPLYREVAGEWVDHPAGSMAPGVPSAAPGSRALANPSAGAASVEFAPVLGAAPTVKVALTWPADANAKGLVLWLEGATPPQRVDVALDPGKANTWQEAGSFTLAGMTAPKFVLGTGTALAPVLEGQPVVVAIDSVRFSPVAVVDDPFATAAASVNPFEAPMPAANPFDAPAPAANPFESAAAPSAVDDPFAAPAAAPVAPAATPNPFESAPAVATSPFEAPAAVASSPFEAPAAVADPFSGDSLPVAPTADPFAGDSVPVASPVDPFAGTEAVDSVAIPLPPAATPAPPSQQPILEPFDAAPAASPSTTTAAVPAPLPSAASLGLGGPPLPGATDPFAAAPGEAAAAPAAIPNAPSAIVTDPTRALAVLGAPGAEGEQGRVITTNLPQPGPSRAPSRSLANTLITGDSSVFASSGQRAFYNPLFDEVQDTGSGTEDAQRVVEIEWGGTYDEGRKKSSAEKKSLVVVFYSENPESEAFSVNLLAQPRVAESLNKAVPVRLRMADNRSLASRLGVFQTPYVVVLDKFGFTEGHISERQDAGAFNEQLNRLLD